IVHRVAEILNKDPLVIRTKGDANPGSIPGTDFPITKGDYIGKVVYVVPQIGYVTRILTPPINYIIIAVIVGIMLVKQFGKPKSGDILPGNVKDKTDSDESGDTSTDKSLSSDKSYLTNDSDILETKTSNEPQNKDSDK
ncbi:MAG: signal peptidase I, partial [Nitrosotalea sp.]